MLPLIVLLWNRFTRGLDLSKLSIILLQSYLLMNMNEDMSFTVKIVHMYLLFHAVLLVFWEQTLVKSDNT